MAKVVCKKYAERLFGQSQLVLEIAIKHENMMIIVANDIGIDILTLLIPHVWALIQNVDATQTHP
jgi:hypothetical protein